MDELITVRPSKRFLEYGGAGSITAICGKEKNLEFRNGNSIEVTNDQYLVLLKLKWIEQEETNNGC